VVDPQLGVDERLLIMVAHDESIFYSNDSVPAYWKKRWTFPLRKKGLGKGLMVSTFICECHGELRVTVPVDILGDDVLVAADCDECDDGSPSRGPGETLDGGSEQAESDSSDTDSDRSDLAWDEDWGDNENKLDSAATNDQTQDGSGTAAQADSLGKTCTNPRVIFEYGGTKGFWTSDKLYAQVIQRAIPVFEELHGQGPNGLPCQALFIFDNATNHKVNAKDALLARKLNVNDGGVDVPLMRDTTFDVLHTIDMVSACPCASALAARREPVRLPSPYLAGEGMAAGSESPTPTAGVFCGCVLRGINAARTGRTANGGCDCSCPGAVQLRSTRGEDDTGKTVKLRYIEVKRQIMRTAALDKDKEPIHDEYGNPKFIQKGLRSILAERGKWPLTAKGKPKLRGLLKVCAQCKNKRQAERDPARAQRTDCCAIRILEMEPDFAAQEGLIAEEVRKRGHIAAFLPKFHPELNRA